MVDLLPPRSDFNPPDFRLGRRVLLDAGKFHDPDNASQERKDRILRSNVQQSKNSREETTGADDDSSGRARLRVDDDFPVYLELRLQLLFGEAPTADTVASYCLGLSRGRIDVLFDFINSRCADEASWEILSRRLE